MNGWWEFLSDSQNEAPRALIAKGAEIPDKPIIADIGDIALRVESENDSEYVQSVACEKLTILANESGHPLDDLLDWYKTPMDMADLARWDMDTVRHVVGQYISDPEFYRGNM